jgi:hypothetical protein
VRILREAVVIFMKDVHECSTGEDFEGGSRYLYESTEPTLKRLKKTTKHVNLGSRKSDRDSNLATHEFKS